MKILLINRCHFIGGGADRVYLNTGKLLEENGCFVIYFSTKDEKNNKSMFEKYFAKNVKTRNANVFLKFFNFWQYLYNFQSYLKIKKLILEYKPDVAHIHLFYGALSGSILIALKKLEIPIVATVHDYRLLCPANAFLDKNNKICEKCINENFFNCTINRCSNGNIFQSLIITLEAYLRKFFIKPIAFIDHFIFVSNFSFLKHIQGQNDFRKKSTLV